MCVERERKREERERERKRESDEKERATRKRYRLIERQMDSERGQNREERALSHK